MALIVFITLLTASFVGFSFFLIRWLRRQEELYNRALLEQFELAELMSNAAFQGSVQGSLVLLSRGTRIPPARKPSNQSL